MTVDTTPPMDRVEMEEILKAVARESNNAAAKIAAIKQLREMNADPEGAGEFDKLDKPLQDEVAARRAA